MKLFAVCVKTFHGSFLIEFYMAEDAEHAEQQAIDVSDDGDVVCSCVVPDPKPHDPTVRSNGHISFVPDTHRSFWEYYVFHGDIYRAATVAPVMPDGRRVGRWYSKGGKERIEWLISIGVNPSVPARVY